MRTFLVLAIAAFLMELNQQLGWFQAIGIAVLTLLAVAAVIAVLQDLKELFGSK